MAEEKAQAKTKTNTFASMKEGQAVFFTSKGGKNQTTVTKVSLGNEGMKFKTADGHGVSMSEKDAYGYEFKDARNTLWTLK